MNVLNPQDMTFLFLGVVACLLAACVALFWSIEDQRNKRRSARH